jgi:hypothetical protein
VSSRRSRTYDRRPRVTADPAASMTWPLAPAVLRPRPSARPGTLVDAGRVRHDPVGPEQRVKLAASRRGLTSTATPAPGPCRILSNPVCLHSIQMRRSAIPSNGSRSNLFLKPRFVRHNPIMASTRLGGGGRGKMACMPNRPAAPPYGSPRSGPTARFDARGRADRRGAYAPCVATPLLSLTRLCWWRKGGRRCCVRADVRPAMTQILTVTRRARLAVKRRRCSLALGDRHFFPCRPWGPSPCPTST